MMFFLHVSTQRQKHMKSNKKLKFLARQFVHLYHYIAGHFNFTNVMLRIVPRTSTVPFAENSALSYL